MVNYISGVGSMVRDTPLSMMQLFQQLLKDLSILARASWKAMPMFSILQQQVRIIGLYIQMANYGIKEQSLNQRKQNMIHVLLVGEFLLKMN